MNREDIVRMAREAGFERLGAWASLTGEEVQFYLAKHRALVNAHYDKVADTNIIAETFDSTAFYKEVAAILKERNT